MARAPPSVGDANVVGGDLGVGVEVAVAVRAACTDNGANAREEGRSFSNSITQHIKPIDSRKTNISYWKDFVESASPLDRPRSSHKKKEPRSDVPARF